MSKIFRMNVNDEIISEIIQGISDFKVIPFFGSGMSARLGIKTWGELIDNLKSELNTTTTDFLDVAQEYENTFGRNKLIEKISYETGKSDFKDDDLGVHYEVLAMNPPIIYTTNWDNAIETAAERIKRKYIKVSSLRHISETPHYANIVVKFHGDFDSPNNIVFTRNDYQTRMNIQHPLDILFRAHILGKKVLFLGYSFSDENIDFIFSKHQELYGTDLLPKSYIVSFKEKFSLERAKQLEKKNIQTIVLDSPKHLKELIRKLNRSVFEKNTNKQGKNFFKSRPLEVLLKSDLENLKEYILSKNYNNEQKAEKFRETVELKEFSSEVECDLTTYLIELINSELSSEMREAIVLSFHHLQFKEIKNLFDIAIELMSWTKYDELNLSLNNITFADVMSTIEGRLKERPTCLAIFLYLVKCLEYDINPTEKQLTRVFETLRDCQWENIGDLSEKFNKEIQSEILNKYYKRYPNLKRIIEKKSMFGSRRTRSRIMKEMEDMIGPNLLELNDED